MHDLLRKVLPQRTLLLVIFIIVFFFVSLCVCFGVVLYIDSVLLHRVRILLLDCIVFFILAFWLVDCAYFVKDIVFVYAPLENLYRSPQHSGESLLWAPEFAGGYPLLATGQLGFAYPLHFI